MQLANTRAFILSCCLITAGLGQASDSTGAVPEPRPEFREYVTESAAAFSFGCAVSLLPLGAAFAAAMRSLWSGSASDGIASAVLSVVGAGAYVGGSVAAANRAGNEAGWSGSFGPSLFLAGGTAVAAGLLAYPTEGASIYAGVIGVPVMAVVGYNIGAKRRESPTSWEERLAPPSLSAHVERAQETDRKQGITYDARLLTLRF